MGRFKYSSLEATGLPSGTSSGGHGPTANTLKEPVQFKGQFSFRARLCGFLVGVLPDCCCGVVNPNPIANNIVRDPIEGTVQGTVAALYAGDGEGMVFPHVFVSAALTIHGKVAVRELITVQRLLSA